MSNSIEIKRTSMKLEAFLLKSLPGKPTLKTGSYLKDFYQSMIFYEEGRTTLSRSQYVGFYERVLKYFSKAIDALSNKHERLAIHTDELKDDMRTMESSEDILYLYEKIKLLM